MAYIMLAALLLRLITWGTPLLYNYLLKQKKLLKQKFIRNKNIHFFENNYIENKAFYVREFNLVPCVSYIGNLDVTKAFDYIKKGNAGQVLAIYQSNYYNWQNSSKEFSRTIFKIKENVLIELGSDFAEIVFAENNYGYANDLMDVFTTFKAAEKEEPFEINIITLNGHGLELKTLPIKPTVLDINLYYNDDFKPIDEIIKQRLAKENDKGIILLHGLPGTGKTTYLRHLIGNIQKKVLFVSPSVAGNLMNPEFIDLLIDNPNAVVIIEDAENIIIDRKSSPNSSVSNLLNISDGLLSDCLNVQIICTFNNALSLVDSALLRKGRLIAKYEFGKLDADKSQLLSNHLGLNKTIHKPMTIAEITNPDDMEVTEQRMRVMGFRKEVMMN